MRPAGVALAFCALAGCFSDNRPQLTTAGGPTTGGDETTATASTASTGEPGSSSTTEMAPTSTTSGTTSACPMGQMKTWYVDGDGDGFGGEPGTEGCEVPPGAIEVGGDCDDAAPAINPDANELCNDLVDDDCDGLLDEYSPDNLECGACRLTEFGQATFWTCLLSDSQAEAEAWCQDHGAAVHLVSPVNAAELAHVRDTIVGLLADVLGEVPMELQFWIGIQRAPALWDSCALDPDAGDWIAVDGAPVEYLVWRGGEPNNLDCTPMCTAAGIADPACRRENCLEIADPAQGLYNDQSCAALSMGHVCKAPLAPGP